MAQKPLTLKRWRRVEYERLVDLGAFEQEPLELLGGQLIVAEPKGSEHATAVDMADDALRAALPGGWIVRVQNPLALDDESAPEPDIAVVRGARSDFRYTRAARPALIIEVAESRWITIGRSGRQRVLFVAHTERDNRIRIISARGATPREQEQYEEGFDEETD
jgi:uncharacterized DUF497 family protein